MTKRTTAFNVGFFGSLILFVAINLFSYSRMYDGEQLSHAMRGFGVPFWLYETGGALTMSYVLWYGLFADVLIASFVSFVVGKICDVLFAKRNQLL